MKAKTWIFFRMFQRIKESVKNLLFVVRLGHRAFDGSMTKPLIGIMVYKPRPLRDYEMAKLLNVDLLVFRPRGIKWSKNKIRGRIYKNGKWERKTCPFPAAVYNRLYSSNRTVVHKLERAIGKGKVFNCITRFDKWEIYNILRESAIHHYVPATYLYHPSNLIPLLKKYNKLILKPSKGQLGRRVYLIERTNNNEYRLYSNLYPQPNNTPNEQDSVKEVNALIGNERFLVQQFIPLDHIDQKKYDIRIYVQKNHQGQWTVSGGFSRVVGSVDSYITNQATEIKSIHDMLKENNMLSTNQLDKMEKISIQAAQAIEYKLGHLGEMAVDFGLDHQGNPWIIEVNGRTQKKFVKRVNDSELTRTIYLKPIEYARFLARSPRKK